ncbi:MAG: putative signal transduction histidine kinase [Spirosoma sp.]|nr:putative signal transduction histidine kinase [Spirosoma sp.]
MRGVALLFLLIFSMGAVVAQGLPALTFHGQPTLEQGISVEPFSLFYEDPTGDTLTPLSVIERQRFAPASQMPQVRSGKARKMTRTSQVVWLQFRVANTHLTDTLHLRYMGGVHAVYSLYRKTNGSFQFNGSQGLCVPKTQSPNGYGTLPLRIPPQTRYHFFVRVADYQIMLDNIAGQLHTPQSVQGVIAQSLFLDRWLLGAMAMILGALLLMCGYSFFQYLLTHDKAFLYYSLYTAVACCFIIALANPRFTLGLTPVSVPYLGHPVALTFTHILGLLYALFLAHLLAVSQNQPSLWRVIRLMMVVLALLQTAEVIQVFTGTWISNNALFMLVDTLPSLLMGLILIVATFRSNTKLKPYLLTGQISLYVVAISPFHGSFVLNNISPVANLFLNYPPVYMMLGLCIELFCFSLALAYRSKLVEEEKKQMQASFAIKLETELDARTLEVEKQSQLLEQQHIRQMELDFEQQLTEIQMTALRAQMNPHFIFNCLNSIQLYTTNNNAAKASDYLNRFSQLIRLVLENSRSERVPLNNELEALRLYLEMEAMRFKDKLRFTVEMNTELDADLIEIPPLLLQPYVENAIWHGLMHKPEGGHVHVKVEPFQTDCLRITITDDGIGRAKAAELKSKSATRHKSFGMKVTGERIAMINRLYQTQTQVQVHDLVENSGQPAGTEVVVEIPV